MHLFFKNPKTWPAKDMPLHLRSPHLVGFVSRAAPAVLFDDKTTTIRMPPMIARAEALNPAIADRPHLCVCCQGLLDNPGKTRTCHQCSVDLKLVMVAVKCETCGVNFERRFSDYTFRLKRKMSHCYCSHACKGPGMALKGKERAKPCAGCGVINPKNQNKFCSWECNKKARRVAKETPQPCGFCNKFFLGRVPTVKTCSESCRRALQVTAIQKTYTSKYGKPEDRRSLLNYPGAYFAMRQFVIARDNATCALCNKKKRKTPMHVHHIDRDKYNNLTHNLITLCSECHLDGHAKKSFDDENLTATCKRRDAQMPESWLSRASEILGLYANEKPSLRGEKRLRSKRRAQVLIRHTCK